MAYKRKPYTSPRIEHELLLETRTQSNNAPPFLDPSSVDPPLPSKPGLPDTTGDGGGSVDPPVPPKPPQSSSGGGDGGDTDPPLPPKP